MERTPYPRSGRRGCQCEDGTYRIDCCDGNSQGIGGLTGGGSSSYSFEDGSTGTTVNINGLTELICNNLTLTGFAVSDTGVITLPTTSIGTITATSPASFDEVTQETLRTLSVTIEVPESYTNTGASIVCTTTAQQQAPILPTLECSDITITGFAVSYDGVITLPTIDIGTIASTSPSSFSDPDEDTLRTLNVNITVPSGYNNAGSTLACTTTATQVGVVVALTCSDITFTGLAIDFVGNITTPTVNIGTVSSISPTTFYKNPVFTATSRTVTVNVTVPSGYTNSGQTLACSQTVSQAVAKRFWAKDYSNASQPNYANPYASTSAACSAGLGINSGYLECIHDGDNNIPLLTDTILVSRFNFQWIAFTKTVNGVTENSATVGISYNDTSSAGSFSYNACLLQDPSTLTTFVTADFYLIHTNTASGASRLGMTGVGTCP